MLIYLGANLLALVGLVLHWFKRRVRKQTGDSFTNYLKVNARYTYLSFLSCLGSVSALVAVSGIDLNDPKQIGSLLLIGFTIDSAVNKGSDDVPNISD